MSVAALLRDKFSVHQTAAMWLTERGQYKTHVILTSFRSWNIFNNK